MDVDDNGAKFFGMNKYENYVNQKKSKENKNGISKSKGEDINRATGEYDQIDAHEDNDQSYEGFVTISDQSSCVSSIYKNDFYDDDDEEEVEKNANRTDEDEKFNSVNGTNQSSPPCHPQGNAKNNSDDSMSEEEYATYIDQKEKYVNKILNRDTNSYEDNDDDFLESLEKSGKKLGKKNNWKRLFSFSKNGHVAGRDERNKSSERSEPVEKAARYAEPDSDQPKSASCTNESSPEGDPPDGYNDNLNGESSDFASKLDECKDGVDDVDEEDDLYSVISGSEGDNEIFLATERSNKTCMEASKGDNGMKHTQPTIPHRQGKEIHNEEENEKGAGSARAKATRRIKFQDEMEQNTEVVRALIQNNKKERLDRKKQIAASPPGVNTIPSEHDEKKRHREKEKHFENKKNYEFKKLVSSTINMCRPKIKGANDTEDILSNMEKISKIVILDERSRGSGTNEVVEEEDESTNSLYDDVDNILDDRKKMYMKKKNEYLMSKTKSEGLTNGVENEKGQQQSSGGSLTDVQKGTTDSADAKPAQAELTNFMYYLNHDMIELNENVFKLYHGTCDYTHRNLCARNIINIVPHLNNIYEGKNLSYIKDSPNFHEVYKVVPEWKNSFEMLNKKAQEDTEDMKNVLKRIENIQNDLDELGRDLTEDKKEFENIKFETVQHESMITNLEKKNKMLIKGVLKLDNMSFKLKKIHNITTNNMTNFTIVENVNRLLKYMDSSLTDYSQLFSEEKTMDILRFQPIDNVYNFLTNTDDESCFIMNLLKEELKEMILEKKDQMQNIIRRTMLYNAYHTNSYKEHITNTLNKQSLMINRIKCNIHCNVMLLFEMYEKFAKKNMKVVKIGENHIKNYLNDETKESYIIKCANDNKKNISKYFNSINFTRNKPIIHPFFIHFCLSDHFVRHFIAFVLDPLSDEHQKNFLQYCSVAGFNSPLFVEKIVKLYRQEEQFTKSDTSYDFRSAYSRISLPDVSNVCNSAHPNQQYERWNEENQYLLALKTASDCCFKSLLENNKFDYLSRVDTNNAFNLFHYIPESITNMSTSSPIPNHASYTPLHNNNNFTFNTSSNGPLSSFGMTNFGSSNKFGVSSPFLNNSTMMNNSSSTLSSSPSGMFAQSSGSLFPGGSSSSGGMFGSFNTTSTTSGMNNQAGALTNQFGSLSNQFGISPSTNPSNTFGTNNMFNTNTANSLSTFNQNRTNSFIGGSSGGMFGSTNSMATGGNATQLGSSSNLFGGTTNSSTSMFGSNFKQNVSSNMFGNNQAGNQSGGSTSNLFGTSGSANRGNFFNSTGGSSALGMSTNTMNANTGLFNQSNNANTNSTLFGGLSSSNANMSNSQFMKSGQIGSSNLFSSGTNTATGMGMNMNVNMNSQSNNSGNMFLSLNNQSNSNMFASNNNSGTPFGKNILSGGSSQLKDSMFSSSQPTSRNQMMSSNFFSANKGTLSTATNSSTFFSNTSMGNTSTGVNNNAYSFGNKQNFGTSGMISGGMNSSQTNQSGNLFNRGGMYAGQMATASGNTNFNNLNNNSNNNIGNRMDNSLSANKFGNYFQNNSTSKSSIFATGANTLSSTSNNSLFQTNSSNKNSNVFNNPSSNNTPMGSMFGGSLTYGSNANSLSYNNSTNRNATNSLLTAQSNNQFRSPVGMMTGNNTLTNSSNNLFQTGNSKSSFMYSSENKGISSPTTYSNNLFQSAGNSFLSNNKPGMTSPSSMSNSLFQKSSYSSLNQNKQSMSSFSSNNNNNNPGNFGFANHNAGIMGSANMANNSSVNRFQQNNSSNFPSVFNQSNKGNTIFSR